MYGSFGRKERKRAAEIESYVFESGQYLFGFAPLLIAAQMCRHELELGEVIVYPLDTVRSRIIVSCVSAVYKQGELSLYLLIDLESFGRVRIELLEIGVELYSVEPEFLYLLDVGFDIGGIRMGSAEAVEALVLVALFGDKCIYSVCLSGRSSSGANKIL